MKTTLKTLTVGMPLVCAAVLSFLLIPCAAHARLNAWDTEKALFFGKWQESATDKGLGIAAGWHDFGAELASAWWFMLYLPTMALLSYLGSSNFGGRGFIPSGWDNGVVALAALGFYVWGVRSGRRTRYLDEAAAATG